jgi:hypothetical protein
MSLNRYPGRHAPARASRLLAAVLLALSAVVRAADISPAENARIEYLMASVTALAGAQFIRNGSTYDAPAAVDHLRLKLRLAGSHVKTAEDFIRYCASASSVSGTPYQIRFADGSLVPSAAYFMQKLKEYDEQRAGGG